MLIDTLPPLPLALTPSFVVTSSPVENWPILNSDVLKYAIDCQGKEIKDEPEVVLKS